MQADRPALIGFMPEPHEQQRLVARSQAARTRPQREVDARNDLPEPKRATRDADLPAVTSPMG